MRLKSWFITILVLEISFLCISGKLGVKRRRAVVFWGFKVFQKTCIFIEIDFDLLSAMTEEEPVGDCGACAKPAQLRCHLALASWNSVTWSYHNGDDLSLDACTFPDQNMMPTIMKRCSGCRLVAYCNAQCQKEHRSEHKDECRWVESKYLSIIGQALLYK